MKNPNFVSVRFAVAVVAITVLTLAMAVVPCWAQNPVPPTAREAAALPEFAAKLHPATRPAMRKPRASARLRTGRALPQYQVIYENGPVNGTNTAWTINFGYIVSDTFVPSNGSVTGFDLYVWEYPGDSVTSLDWSITSEPNGGTVYGSGTVSGPNLTDQFISSNQFSFDIDKISASGLSAGVTPGSTYWVNLQNAVTSFGEPVYWDENSGVGCHSQGCPSQAYESAAGTIPSEAFDVVGGSPPPPCYQSQGNMQIIHDFTGQEDGSNPSGVVADAAGNVYGPMGDMVYEIASQSQGWVFNILYTFTGGANGSSPSTPIVGPEGALYGTALGGSSGLGLIYSLRPPPTPCLTALCPWRESVVYQPTGNNDAYDPGNLVFDQAGNLYGTSGSGGAYGQGAVFKLMPSPSGWTETILYSFTGGSDGAGPGSLAVGIDGNLYGTGGGNAYPYGMVFQLARPPSGGSWTENVIYSFTDLQDGAGPYDLVQGGLGSLVGLSNRFAWGGGWVFFVLSPSQGGWEFSVIESLLDDSGWSNTALAAYRGDVYYANGYVSNCGGRDCASPDEIGWGVVSVLRPPGQLSDLWLDDGAYMFLPSGQLGVDANRNVYGTTGNCGKYGLGAVWKLTN